MLTPDELKVAPDNIVALYQRLEDDIIADIARRLEKAGEITSTAEWQIYMLTEMGKDLDDIKSKIAEVNHKSKAEVENIFDEAIARSVGRDNLLFQQAGKGTLDLAKNAGMQQFIAASAAKTAGDLKNLTKSLGFKDGKQFKPIARFYQDTLNYAQFQIASGAFSYQQAIKTATAKMVESGIRVVDYESGVSTRIDVAVRRATLTGINQTSGVITMRWLDEVGGEYVEVTAHTGARPDHAVWQGKVYKVNGSEKEYPNLAEATGYGSVTGLKGANCRHDFNAFFPGISERNYTDKELENIDPPPFEYNGKNYTHYEATQKQRQIERAIRKTKQEMIAYDAAGLKDDFTGASVKLQRQKQLYRDFSAKAGLRTKNERHQLFGFGKSVSQKGVQAAKAWTKTQNGAKIVPTTKTRRSRKKVKYTNQYPKQVAGVKRGAPMSFEKANQLRSNPLYMQGKEYQINCQTCVVSHEARLRGYNVEAKGNTKGSLSEVLSRNTNKAWIDPKTGTHPTYIFERKEYTPKTYMVYLSETLEDGKRYTMEFEWKKERAGHIVCMEKIDNGSIRLYDPQNGKSYYDDEIELYLKDIKFFFTKYGNKFYTPPKLLNVSEMEFNLDMVHKILKGATT